MVRVRDIGLCGCCVGAGCTGVVVPSFRLVAFLNNLFGCTGVVVPSNSRPAAFLNNLFQR